MTSKPTVLKSIFFSGILHVFVFTAFAFSFSLKPFQPRPFFLFIGSILQKQDFLTAHNDHSLAPLDIKMDEISLEENKISSVVSLSKPALSTSLKAPGKTPWKPLLIEEGKDNTGTPPSSSLKGLGIAPEIPPYVPLRSHPP